MLPLCAFLVLKNITFSKTIIYANMVSLFTNKSFCRPNHFPKHHEVPRLKCLRYTSGDKNKDCGGNCTDTVDGRRFFSMWVLILFSLFPGIPMLGDIWSLCLSSLVGLGKCCLHVCWKSGQQPGAGAVMVSAISNVFTLERWNLHLLPLLAPLTGIWDDRDRAGFREREVWKLNEDCLEWQLLGDLGIWLMGKLRFCLWDLRQWLVKVRMFILGQGIFNLYPIA